METQKLQEKKRVEGRRLEEEISTSFFITPIYIINVLIIGQ